MSQPKNHHYQLELHWTGNLGQGTENYRVYDRAHSISVDGKPTIAASADPAFRGDRGKYNPEELLVASVSSCHMLWYLHLCSDAKVIVTGYADYPLGTMVETEDGSGKFVKVLLRPVVTLSPQSDAALATQLHDQAHHKCFIANSVNFPVQCEPTIQFAP